MTRNLLRAGALSCALLTSTAFCTQPALAQTAREHRALDENGVDLTHGDYVMSITEGSIGSGESELALVRTGAWYSGYNGHQWDNISFRREVSGATVTYQITVGTRAETFTSTGTLPSGSSLSGDGNYFIYRRADGTTIEFTDGGNGGWGTDSNFCTGAFGQGSCTLLPTAITSPDGRSVVLNWDVAAKCSELEPITSETLPCTYVARLGSVSNSFGYEIRFTHASQNAGGSGGAPPAWFQRTSATFHNNNVSGSPAQGSVSYTYPSVNVMEVTDMAGRVWRIAGAFSSITGIRRPGAASDTTTISYVNGVVSSVTRDGVTTSYAHSVSGSTATTTVTNALNQQSVVVSNLTIGRPTSITDALSRQTSYQYDSSKRLTRVTAPEGNYVQYTYDARGNVTETRVVGKPGSGVADIVTTASYDASCVNPVTCNSPNSVTDARGNVTDFTYDATHGGVLSVTAPAPGAGATRPQTRYAYTLLNGEYRLTAVSACASGTAPGCVGTASESRTEIGYDAQGNVTSTTQRDGTGALSATQAMTYNALGDVVTVDGPLAGAGDTTRLRYNAGRELIGTISADPDGAGPLKHRASRNIIDATSGLLTRSDIGIVDSQSDAHWLNMAVHQSMEAGYDANARPVVQKLVAGGTTYSLAQTSYDALGRPECTAQRMNPAAFGALPASACSLGTEGTFGPDRITKASYDAAGQVTQLLTAVGTPDQAVEAATTYRNNGQVETLTDGEGNMTTYAYDGHDRLKQTLYPSPTTDGVSSTTDYEELTYDAGGNVTSARMRDGKVIGMAYDALNRLTFRDRPGTATFETDQSFSYDLLGRLTGASDSIGHQISFGYDGLGRPTSQASNWYGTTGAEYDVAGRRTRLIHPWSVGNETFEYLVTGEMKIVGNYAGTLMATIGYDDLGRRTGLARLNGTSTAYGYDAVGRLASMSHDFAGTGHDVTFSFTHNPAGQITSRTASNDAYSYTGVANQNVTDSHNGLNQIVTAGLTAVTHDGRGNTAAIGSAGYTYTADNRMATGGGSNFYHDMLGRMAHSSGAGLNFMYDIGGGQLISEQGSSGITAVHVQGPGVDEQLMTWEPGSGALTQLHADERGSIIATSDGGGNVTAINRYDEYGAPQGPGGAGTQAGRFGYTGQAWMPELGMYNYKARIYNPA
jgi:YD repeat-containing protein